MQGFWASGLNRLFYRLRERWQHPIFGVYLGKTTPLSLSLHAHTLANHLNQAQLTSKGGKRVGILSKQIDLFYKQFEDNCKKAGLVKEIETRGRGKRIL